MTSRRWALLTTVSASIGITLGGATRGVAQVAITEYSTGITAGSWPMGIAAGPDGALWFTEYSGNRIGRITTAGVVTEYSAGITGRGLRGITAGPDGALWFTEWNSDRIGRITTAGVVTEYSAGITAGAMPLGITAGLDGALWFAESAGNRIGRITTAGVVTEYSTGITAGAGPWGITAGPDGALWFTELDGNRIGRITTAGVVTEYSAGISPQAWPAFITAGPDGALWFAEPGREGIGRITTAGVVTEYSAGISPEAGPAFITAGPDGALWFTESAGNRIGRITTAGAVTEYSTGITAGAGPSGITAGPDGTLWFAEQDGNRIGRITGLDKNFPLSRWLSAVAHVDVPASNAYWRSDVAVLNRTGTPAQLELRAYTSGGMLTMASSVGPNAQVLFKDVAAQLGLTNGSAAFEVRSNQDIFLSGRTYNQVAFDTTYGQDYDGMDASTLLGAGQSAYLTQLTQNAYFRSNVGVTNAGTGTASVAVTIYDGTTGAQLWTDTRSYDPGGFYQYNQPLKSIGSDNAYAKITVNSGSGVFGYASVIDQKTNDATTVVIKNRATEPQIPISEYSAGITAGALPKGITAGPDGALWFTEEIGNRIGRITTAGVVTEYSAGITPKAYPWGITAGPDGALWFTEWNGNRIGRITTAGVVTEYSAGITAEAVPLSIAAGPDGALWFTEYSGNRIGRITTAGVVTEYSAGITGTGLRGITAGPDGALWFTESRGDRIGRITTAGVVTEYSAGVSAASWPLGITTGPDGALWFTEARGHRVGRITTAGVVTEYSAGITAGANPYGIAVGPDGALWFTEWNGNRIGRITTGGVVTEYSVGITAGAGPSGIVAGPDDALWFTEDDGNRIGRITGLPPALQYARWLSAVAHVDVPSSNAYWRSDVAALNRTGTTAQLELRAYTSAGVLTMLSSVGPSAQVLFKDVAAQLGLTNGSAAFEVRSSQDIFLSGRTYNQVAFDTTYGQDYDGMDANTLLSAGQSAYLTQLTQNAYFRSNIGVTNAGTGTASVTVTIYDGTSGAQLYSDTRSYDPGGFYQYNQPLKSLGNTDNAYAKLTVNSGSGVFSYASVIDQKTNDATTVVMKK